MLVMFWMSFLGFIPSSWCTTYFQLFSFSCTLFSVCFCVVMHHCVHLIWPCHVQYVLWSDLINKSLFLHLHQFHWFSSLLMSRWFHTESDHPMTATDVRVHYLHSWSWMMKCFPSVVSEWRKWKTTQPITCHLAPLNLVLSVFLKVWRSQITLFWFSGKKTTTNV